jgi:hypothetical integral membrane protein (TIGR02206 family)
MVIIAFIVLTSILLGVGIRWRGTARERKLDVALGTFGVIVWLLANGYGFLPGQFEWRNALPLHVCDLCALAGPISLMLAQPPAWLRSMVYFWGFGLCTQAFLTPTLLEGPADPKFWFFWAGHFFILMSALHELIVRRWRPTWRHWRIAIMLNTAYLAVVLPLDIAFGWNYGFVGREIKAGTMIEILGPWPWRVAVIYALTALAHAAMVLPWATFGRGGRRRTHAR